ncbi:MAG TPA: methyltransferase domain-containing protein [Gaiellaceae bacterium]|nr:methyltransferase domain-containing protein [Gaiellaceae bacterium]
MDVDEYRRTSLESWQAMASGWERRREEIERVTLPVSDWMVHAIDPQPGDTVLELAAGPGGTGFAAAAILGEQGLLISSDFSSEMVEVARRRSEKLGLANVEHRVMDAEEMSLEDDSVDGVLCRFGFMLMPDPAAALAETRRVLRPEGRLALAVWGTAAENPWVAIAGRILAERGLTPPPEPGAPGMFVLADEARLRQLLQDAGFDVERVERVSVRFAFDDVDDYIARTTDLGGMFSRIWGDASDEDREVIRTRLAEDYERFAVDGRYELPGIAVVASAS